MTVPTISVQLYTIKEAMEADLEGTIERVAKMGFTTVELHRFTENTARQRAALRGAGLASPTAHARLLSVDDNEQRRIFAAAAELDAKTVIDPKREKEFWVSEDDAKGVAEGLNKAAAVAREYGLTVGYHTHDQEIDISHGGMSAIEYIAELLAPDIMLEIDTWWGTRGDKDLAAIIRNLGPRVQALHIKDGSKSGLFDQKPAGQGDVDLDILLKAATYSQLAVIEFDGRRFPGEPFAGIAASRDFLVRKGLRG